MDEHLKLFLWTAFIMGCLYSVYYYFGAFYLKFILYSFLGFFAVLAYIMSGNSLSMHLVGRIFFFLFLLIVAGVAVYFILQLRIDMIEPIMKAS